MSSIDKLKSLLRSGEHTELLKMATWEVGFLSMAKRASFDVGKSPMHLAVATGNVDIVKELAALGFDLNALEQRVTCGKKQFGGHYSALHVAVRQRDLPMVKALLDLGADVSVKCWMDTVFVGTAEFFARSRGYAEIADAILNHGSKETATVTSSPEYKVGTLSSVLSDHKKYKSDISAKLRKAQFVNDKLEAISKDSKANNTKLVEAKAKKAKLATALQEEEQNVRICESKVKKLAEEETQLKKHPDYLSTMERERLENKMRALSKEETELRGDPIEADVLDCVVCMSPPSANAFSCQDCGNLVCNDCLNKLDKCPSCRVVFAGRPANRNRIAERMLEKMKLN